MVARNRLLLLLVSSAACMSSAIDGGASCPQDWHDSPIHLRTVFNGKCYWNSVDLVHSPMECISACGSGAPTTFTSEEEEQSVRAGMAIFRVWGGMYKRVSDNTWKLMTSGVASKYHNFIPGDTYNSPSSWYRCMHLTNFGWDDQPCVKDRSRCFCSNGNSAVSPSVAQELGPIVDDTRRFLASTAFGAFVVAVVLALTPTWIYLASRCFARMSQGRPRSGLLSKSGQEQADSRALLADAKQASTSLRVRVSFTLFQVGLLGLSITGPPFVLGSFMINLNSIIGGGTWFLILVPFSISAMLLSVFPIDAAAIRFCGVFFFLSFILLGFLNVLGVVGGLSTGVPWFITVVSLLATASFIPPIVLLSPVILCSCCCAPSIAWSPRGSLRRVWLSIRVWSVGLGLSNLLHIPGSVALDPNVFANYPDETWGLMFFCIGFLVCAMISTPANRGRVHRWLGSFGGKGSEQQQAAAIAALVGRAHPDKILAQAEAHFRVLPLDLLNESDLTDNSDTGVFQRTQPAKLGECTAFISHSWRDDGVLKYKALQEFAAPLRLKKEAPSMWLDKGCIDQNNIDASLAALPIYLSGCKTLLILAGATYPTRLWCVMELYSVSALGV